MCKEDLAEKRSLVATMYDAAPHIPGISGLHSFTFHKDGVVEIAKCCGAQKIVNSFPLQLLEIVEEVKFSCTSLVLV
jgi:hypothetical protein